MNNSFSVFFTIDENYIKFFTVAITSLLKNNKDLKLDIYLIHDIKDLSALHTVITYLKEEYNVDLKLLTIDSSIFNKYKLTLHVSKATYFRLLLAEIIPSHINTGLFLDSDIVVTGSIKELVMTDIKENYLLASSDLHYPQEIERLNNIGIPADKYFNAGVMLVNLALWRKNRVSKMLIQTAEKYMEHLKWWDQDVLNIYFFNKWDFFDSTYNSVNLRRRLNPTPIIIHYISPTKPWHYLNNHPYKALFWQYIRFTPYKDYSYEDYSFSNFLYKYYKKIVVRLNLLLKKE